MKKKKLVNLLPFIIVFLLLIIFHLYTKFMGDDLWFSRQLSKYSIIKFASHRYNTWSSRFIIESVLITLTRLNINVWRLINIIMYMIGIFVSLYLVNTKKDKYINIVACLLFLMYPLADLSTAGWAATTLNYLWCFSLGMLSFIPLINYERNKKTNYAGYIFSILGLLYATNQEQMCAIIFGFNFLYLIYKIFKHEKISKYNIFCLIISIAGLILILACPGNKIRALKETQKWFPEYTKYGVLQKTYLGIISMASILVSNKVVLFIFVSILSYATFIYSKKSFSKVLSVFTFFFVASITVFSKLLINTFPSIIYLSNTLNYQGIPSLVDKYALLPFIISVNLILCIIYMLLVVFKRKEPLPIIIFLAGICSKLILGFSPTIFISGSRTAFFLYMSLIIVSLYIVHKMYKDNKLNYNSKIVIISVLFLFSLFNYISSFIVI